MGRDEGKRSVHFSDSLYHTVHGNPNTPFTPVTTHFSVVGSSPVSGGTHLRRRCRPLLFDKRGETKIVSTTRVRTVVCLRSPAPSPHSRCPTRPRIAVVVGRRGKFPYPCPSTSHTLTKPVRSLCQDPFSSCRSLASTKSGRP